MTWGLFKWSDQKSNTIRKANADQADKTNKLTCKTKELSLLWIEHSTSRYRTACFGLKWNFSLALSQVS